MSRYRIIDGVAQPAAQGERPAASGAGARCRIAIAAARFNADDDTKPQLGVCVADPPLSDNVIHQ